MVDCLHIYNTFFVLTTDNDKAQPSYEDDEISIGYRSIPKNATTKSLKSLGVTTNFIGIWLKSFVNNYDARCVAYINTMKEMFNKIPQTMSKALTPKKIPETYYRY